MRSISILMYHSLDYSDSVISVTPQIFKTQMGELSELGYSVISLKQAVSERQEKGDWPEKSVVLTFDDGYANVYEHALPVLLQYGFSATVFIVAGHMDGINNWKQSNRYFDRQTMLSWNQVKELVSKGIEIGAHTLNHPNLSKLEADAIEREIVESVKQIGSHIDEPVQTFAYPFGGISDETVAIVGRTFQAACTTEHRRACNEPLTLLPRIEMYYFRNQQNLQSLIAGRLDRKLAVRRLAREFRHFLPF